MMMKSLLLGLLATAASVSAQVTMKAGYGLDQAIATVALETTYNLDGTVKFTIIGRTIGWVGIGIGPEASAGHVNMDIIMGSVTGSTVTLWDCWSNAKGVVVKDTVQSFTGVTGSEVNGFTTISFTRKANTGDAQDTVLIGAKNYAVSYAVLKDSDDLTKPHTIDPFLRAVYNTIVIGSLDGTAPLPTPGGTIIKDPIINYDPGEVPTPPKGTTPTPVPGGVPATSACALLSCSQCVDQNARCSFCGSIGGKTNACVDNTSKTSPCSMVSGVDSLVTAQAGCAAANASPTVPAGEQCDQVTMDLCSTSYTTKPACDAAVQRCIWCDNGAASACQYNPATACKTQGSNGAIIKMGGGSCPTLVTVTIDEGTGSKLTASASMVLLLSVFALLL